MITCSSQVYLQEKSSLYTILQYVDKRGSHEIWSLNLKQVTSTYIFTSQHQFHTYLLQVVGLIHWYNIHYQSEPANVISNEGILSFMGSE